MNIIKEEDERVRKLKNEYIIKDEDERVRKLKNEYC